MEPQLQGRRQWNSLERILTNLLSFSWTKLILIVSTLWTLQRCCCSQLSCLVWQTSGYVHVKHIRTSDQILLKTWIYLKLGYPNIVMVDHHVPIIIGMLGAYSISRHARRQWDSNSRTLPISVPVCGNRALASEFPPGKEKTPIRDQEQETAWTALTLKIPIILVLV